MTHNRWFFLLLIFLFLVFVGCQNNYTPKPRGYFRIDFSEKTYQQSSNDLPFTFMHPQYSMLKTTKADSPDQKWLNIDYPRHNAKIHLSYVPIENNVETLIKESYELAYEHSLKATSIEEEVIENRTTHVYGTIFNIQGNAASPIQFFLTDSTRHYLRGALYFMEVPNYDSLLPVISFIKEDVDYLMETMNWKPNANN